MFPKVRHVIWSLLREHVTAGADSTVSFRKELCLLQKKKRADSLALPEGFIVSYLVNISVMFMLLSFMLYLYRTERPKCVIQTKFNQPVSSNE